MAHTLPHVWRSFAEFRALAKENTANVWNQPSTRGTDSAAQRLAEPIFRAALKPSFSLSRQETFFMLGSCFARGLEKILALQGVEVRSLSSKFDHWQVDRDEVTPLGATNRYNTGSLVNEFRWALDPIVSFPDEAYLEVGPNAFVDPHMTPTFAAGPKAEVQTRRKMWHDLTAALREVDVVILTLGLAEVWRDDALGLICNTVPDPRVARREPDRFSFGRLGFQDNLDNLNTIHTLMQQHGKPGHRFIVTVSPVPLQRTFTEFDIVQANTYSKSVLRAAAEEFALSHDNVDYFSSYEIALNSSRDLVWEEDLRHVRGSFAKEIMAQFLQTYFG